MKNQTALIAATLFGTLCFASNVLAEQPVVKMTVDQGYTTRVFGVGAILGDPTAIALKLRFDDLHAVQLGVGWGWLDPYGDRITLILDYLYHFSVLSSSMESIGLFQPYVGFGGKLGLHEGPYTTTFGGRVPLGLALHLRDAPIEIFAEVAPGLLLIPGLRGTVDGGIGARFYF